MFLPSYRIWQILSHASSKSPNVSTTLRMTMMRALLLAILLPSLAFSQEMKCRRENGELICEFRISEETEQLQTLLKDCPDGFCVDVMVKVSPVPAFKQDQQSSGDSSSGDINQQASKPAAEQNVVREEAKEDKNALVIAGHTYAAPWSQYSDKVVSSLQERPALQRSWLYGDWLIKFAIAVRGDPYAPDGSWDPSSIEKSVKILESSVELFQSLDGGHGDGKVSLGNSYMTLGETMIFDPYNPNYERALEHFEASNTLFKQALEENKFPLGITRADVELNWADTLVRLAVLTIESKMGGMEMDLLGGGMGQLTEATQRAETMLEDAIAAFRQLVKGTSAGSKAQLIQRRTRLANALQNYASISMMVQMDFAKTNALLEEAVDVYEACLEEMDETNPDRATSISGVAEALYSLADGYLQAGKYDKAKERYQNTMVWYKKYGLASPAVQDVPIADADETLAASEQALEDYNSMLYGGGELQIPNDRQGTGEQIYQNDELYEADLHASIGALRMAKGEAHMAVNHLANAIELYARNPVGRALGDARLNLAMVYFKQGEYELSMEEYADALDVYKEVIGEGKNPLMEGLEDLLAQHGVDPETLQQATGGEASGDAADKVIDLEAYQASILNATTMTDEL